MPTLNELRRWATGEAVKGLPDNRAPTRSERLVEHADKATQKYKISSDGQDALLKFGKHTGKTVSSVARKDPGYLEWILNGDFDAPLKDVAKYVLKSAK
jgi:hypothetical protein